MRELDLRPASGSPLRVLCLGAHADDIEIGCGGLLLDLAHRAPSLEVRWVVFSGGSARAREARKSAALFLKGVRRKTVTLHRFTDGFFPYEGARIKRAFEALKTSMAAPDLVLTHYRDDRHQDHRVISDLTWNTFRDHLVLEYEIPKYDGDLGAPNCFVPLGRDIGLRKASLLTDLFSTQVNKHWFNADTFLGLMRLRGVECRASEGYAEAFYGRKLVLRVGQR